MKGVNIFTELQIVGPSCLVDASCPKPLPAALLALFLEATQPGLLTRTQGIRNKIKPQDELWQSRGE